jgi:hypothetical protein
MSILSLWGCNNIHLSLTHWNKPNLKISAIVLFDFKATLYHPELPGVASLRKLQTNPRIHGCDIVLRKNTIDTIEVLYSYLADMASPTQMHNVLCGSVTIEARFTASSRRSGSHIGIGPISTGPVTAESEECCGRRCMYRMHCIRCSHFKVDDVSALEPSSKPPVRIVEDNVTASLHQQRTMYGLDAVTTQRGFASAGGHKHSAGLNTVWL